MTIFMLFVCIHCYSHDITFLCQSAKEHDETAAIKKNTQSEEMNTNNSSSGNAANKSHHDAIGYVTVSGANFPALRTHTHTHTHTTCTYAEYTRSKRNKSKESNLRKQNTKSSHWEWEPVWIFFSDLIMCRLSQCYCKSSSLSRTETKQRNGTTDRWERMHAKTKREAIKWRCL